jgi:hypothetical protein
MIDRPLVIVGAGTVLERFAAAWKSEQPQRTIEVLEVDSPDHFTRNLDRLDGYPAEQWCAFAALTGSGVNMARLKLMLDIRMKGYKLDSFLSPAASVPKELTLPENCFISAGAVVEDKVKVRHNLYVGPRAVIGSGTQLGHSVWISSGALLGTKVSIGDNSVVGTGAVVADNVQVGKFCELNIAQEYRTSIESKTFFSPMFDGPVRIYGSRSCNNP